MKQHEVAEHLNTLGLEPGESHTPEDLKKAWRKQCTQHHPDKGGDADQFRAVCHSYKMLTDPSYREENAKEKRGPKLDMQIVVPVKFEDAFFGKTVTASWNRVEFGEDWQPVSKVEQEVVACSTQMPIGQFRDHVMMMRGKGARRGEVSGDCAVIFRPIPSQRFQVSQEGDVVTTERVPLDVLLRGGEIEVQTMFGLKTLKVPAGTPPGGQLRIKKCGVAQRGEHIVVTDVVYPTADDLKSDAWKGLDINWDASQEAEAVQAQEDEEFEQAFMNLGGYTTIRFTSTGAP